MKKRIIVYGILGIVVAGVLGYPFLRPGAGVTLPNYYRIQPGMSHKEVDDLLNDGAVHPWCQGQPLRVANQGWIEYWKSGHIWIAVVYDTNARVVEKEWERIPWEQLPGRNRLWPPDWFRVETIRE